MGRAETGLPREACRVVPLFGFCSYFYTMKKRTLSVPWKATWTSLADVTLLVVETWARARGRRPLLAMTSRAGAGVVLAGCDRDRQEWRRHTCPSDRPPRPPPSASAAVCSVVCAAGSWLSESSGENATFSSVLSHHNLLSLSLSRVEALLRWYTTLISPKI